MAISPVSFISFPQGCNMLSFLQSLNQTTPNELCLDLTSSSYCPLSFLFTKRCKMNAFTVIIFSSFISSSSDFCLHHAIKAALVRVISGLYIAKSNGQFSVLIFFNVLTGLDTAKIAFFLK
jgi:hypothetical protein